jgi:WD40 repeat protein/mono/diheme cytochrome c family protein
MMRRLSLTTLVVFSLAAIARADAPKSAPTYVDVHAIFAKNCLSCHDAKEAEGELVLESHESLLKGGDSGKAIVPARSDESLLVKLIEQTKKPYMPPPKKGKKLTDEEIKTIRAWIDAGALAGEKGSAAPLKTVVLPKIAPRTQSPASINALAAFASKNIYAAGLPGVVELRSFETRLTLKRLEGHKGNVNDLAFSANGSVLAAAAGEPGVAGEVKLWQIPDGTLLRTIDGHTDAVYSVAISTDGKTLATGSYDQLVKLWDVESGKELRTLKGHNGCVFDLAFRPDGKVLASVSADRTLKLWDVATGNRLDTRPESLKDLFAVAFSPDGSRVYAAGVDNRIRVWSVSAEAKEGTNKLLQSVFAHEGAILRLAFSSDGKTLASSADNKTVKLWNPIEMTIRAALPEQRDWPTALALTNTDLLVGRLDGSIDLYDPASGKIQPAPPGPELTAAEPRAIQRGGTTKLKLTGKNLSLITSAKSPESSLKIELTPDAKPGANAVSFTVTAPKELMGLEVALSVVGPTGESNQIKLFVDSLPQTVEQEPNASPSQVASKPLSLPAAVWGVLSKQGDADHFAFDFKGGQAVVIDVAANRIGAKTDAVLTLFDSAGNVIASTTNFEGSPDPLLVFTPPSDARYVVKVNDLQISGSPEHFYRLSVGSFPFVTGVFPLGVPANAETKVQLLGFNLAPDASAVVKAGAMEVELPVPIDPLTFRKRREPKVLVSATPTVVESEPNDTPEHATKIPTPGIADGRIGASQDLDLYRFDAKKDQTWIVETLAARRGSPCDTKIEVLNVDGKPVPRVLLRAVRDSYIEFRPIGPNDGGGRLKNWEEMELNDYLYLNGEVVKLFLAPRGPDSTWDFYTLGGARRCYFDTSASTHAIDDACYIVDPLPPGSTPAPNGLPLFPLNYVNDDDAERKLGTDSRLTFTAPANSSYLVRVTDTRGLGSERHAYRLIVRQAKPDFNVTLTPDATAVPPGSGVGFTVRADRADNFDADIRVDVAGLPPGFTASTPIVIQAGHIEARGAIRAAANAPQTTDANAMSSKLTATATVNGQLVTKPVNGFGKLTVGGKPPVTVSLETTAESQKLSESSAPAELTIAPGQMISAWLGCERDSHKGLVSFDVQNLPHGVIVADIGLNGVLIPEKETRRQIFMTCANWVPDQDRLIFARAREAGNPTSAPVLLHVRKPHPQQAAAAAGK